MKKLIIIPSAVVGLVALLINPVNASDNEMVQTKSAIEYVKSANKDLGDYSMRTMGVNRSQNCYNELYAKAKELFPKIILLRQNYPFLELFLHFVQLPSLCRLSLYLPQYNYSGLKKVLTKSKFGEILQEFLF